MKVCLKYKSEAGRITNQPSSEACTPPDEESRVTSLFGIRPNAAADINSLLDQLEHDCQEIEARDSDESV